MKTPSLLLQTLLAGGLALAVAAPRPARAQASPAPTPPSTCPPFGWAEGLAQYTTLKAPFPTQDTKNNPTSDCIFHMWSWEAFVWATAIDATTKQPRFLTLPNLDGLDQANKPELAKVGPKPLVLKPRTLKPRGSQQDIGEFEQAGSQGVLVDQKGQAVYYSQHANDIYYQFVKKYYGIANYQKASATLQFPLGAAVFKAAWRIVPEGENASTVFTTAATVPLLINNPDTKKGGVVVDPSGKTRQVNVALVGLHVVGITVNHPEFLWGTFEQVQNAPDLPAGVLPPSQPVSDKDFTFYKAGTLAADCNVLTSESVSDPGSQTLTPITNVFRRFAYGGETKLGMTEIDSVNSQSQSAVKGFRGEPQEAIWANYKLIGTVWIRPNTLQPGDGDLDTEAVGSVNLANATLETFVQNPHMNCFSCHNTGANSEHKIPGKDINLSHKILQPFFTDPKATRTPHRLTELEK